MTADLGCASEVYIGLPYRRLNLSVEVNWGRNIRTYQNDAVCGSMLSAGFLSRSLAGCGR